MAILSGIRSDTHPAATTSTTVAMRGDVFGRCSIRRIIVEEIQVFNQVSNNFWLVFYKRQMAFIAVLLNTDQSIGLNQPSAGNTYPPLTFLDGGS